MAQDYYTILTNAGLAYEAQQKAQNKPITLVAMAIGDGNGATYNPDPAATTLRREVHRQPINSLLQDANNPTWLVAEAWLADEVGGWTIREVGIYTDTGVLYAIAKYPESIKPLLASGSGKQFYVRTIFQTSNVASVVLQVDNSVVMATRAFVADYVRDELAKLDSKQSVRVATTVNIALTGLQTIDGVVLAAGDRVLVKDQAASKDNGIYVAVVGAWARAADADTAAKITPELAVGVEQGVVNGDSLWMLTTDAPIMLGATALTFEICGGSPLATKAWVQDLTATTGMVVLSNPGVTSWNVPDVLKSGAKKPYVIVIGAGGGCAAFVSVLSRGAGGGGSSEGYVDLAGVQSVTCTVAQGAVGQSGGSSSFGTFMSASGGLSGATGGGAYSDGGSGSGGTLNRKGALGGGPDATYNGEGGASPYSTSTPRSGSGIGGVWPGGGAGAGSIGQIGAHGAIIIKW